jgi:hypothetical protein
LDQKEQLKILDSFDEIQRYNLDYSKIIEIYLLNQKEVLNKVGLIEFIKNIIMAIIILRRYLNL